MARQEGRGRGSGKGALIGVIGNIGIIGLIGGPLLSYLLYPFILSILFPLPKTFARPADFTHFFALRKLVNFLVRKV